MNKNSGGYEVSGAIRLFWKNYQLLPQYCAVQLSRGKFEISMSSFSLPFQGSEDKHNKNKR
jgi:hypothetical protein